LKMKSHVRKRRKVNMIYLWNLTKRKLYQSRQNLRNLGNGEFIEANLFKETKEEKQERTKQELQLEHSQVELDENYEFPPIALLELGEAKKAKSKTQLADNALKLQKTLHSFGVSAKVEDVAVRTCNYKI